MFGSVQYRLDPASRGAVARLVRELGCTETFAWILARRGLDTPEAVRDFLATAQADVDPSAFHDPMLLGEMPAAVERIRFAIDNQEPIAVHGDYDADGICSTLIVTEALERLGATVQPFLPNRFEHGYGLALETVEQLATAGARVLIAVDCGITGVEPVAHARELGMDVIICDHHQPGPELPDAILCSTRPSDYPFPDLCAAGVAGKLADALGAPPAGRYELEAIATVADCVPLVGENRAIVRRGLSELRATERVGLRALLSAASVHPRDVGSDDISFRIAPRLNAVGRIAHPGQALDLLRAADADEAASCARLVEDTNERRRRIEAQITAQAIEQIESWTPAERARRAYVVAGQDWHEGVVGIVASRLVERYHRPVVVIAQQDPLSRGSGRSPDTYDLHAGLAACDAHLNRWGGHRQAAGLTIDPARIDAFAEALAAHANEHLSDDQLVAHMRVDAVTSGGELGFELCREIAQLAPFGEANPRPQVLLAGSSVEGIKTIGDGGAHLRAIVSVDGVAVSAVAFSAGEHAGPISAATALDVVGELDINRFRGREELQLRVRHFSPVPPSASVIGIEALAREFPLADRRTLAELARDAAEAPEPIAGATPVDTFSGSREVRDLRGRHAAHSQIARLAAAGQRIAVVCADVARRAGLLDVVLNLSRLGSGPTVVISGRCSDAAVSKRLALLETSETPYTLLIDHDAIASLPGAIPRCDAVVVLDPPVTESDARALAAAAPAVATMHLVHGAAEERFSRSFASAARDGRATLKGCWSKVRDGATSGVELEAALWGAEHSHLNTARAVRHVLWELARRDIAHLRGDTLELGTPQT